MEFQAGLLGAGFIAPFHVRAMSRIPGARIAWVCDADRKKAEALAATIPGAKAMGSLDEMLAGKPDVVHVLLPPNAHASTTISCLASGANVFVEKPLATSAQEAKLIAAAAEAAGKQVGVNHNLIFNPTFQKLVGAVKARKLGQLEHLSVTWNVPLRQLSMGQHGHWIFQAPANILLEQAVHPLSMVQFLLGDLVRASALPSDSVVLSTGKTFHKTWQVSLVCQRGTAGLQLSFGREFQVIRVLAIGQDGSAELDLKRSTFSLRTNGFQEPPLDDLYAGIGEGVGLARNAAGNFARMILGTVKAAPAYDPFGDSIASSLTAFYSSLTAGNAPPVGLARGRAVVEMCEAIGTIGGQSQQVGMESVR